MLTSDKAAQGLSKANLATLGIAPELLERLWVALSDSGPSSPRVAGAEPHPRGGCSLGAVESAPPLPLPTGASGGAKPHVETGAVCSIRERLLALEQKERESQMPKARAKPPSRGGGKIAAMQASLGLAEKFSPMMLIPGLPPTLLRDEEGHVIGVGPPSTMCKARALEHSMSDMHSPMIMVPDSHRKELNEREDDEVGLGMLRMNRAAAAGRRPSRRPAR